MDRLSVAYGTAETGEGAESSRMSGPRLAIGELAGEFGLTHRTIRHYEDEGLLTPERVGSARGYGHRDRARLGLIVLRVGVQMGLTLCVRPEDLFALAPGVAQ